MPSCFLSLLPLQFSKMVNFVAMPELQSAQESVEVLAYQISRRYKISDDILSARAPQFLDRVLLPPDHMTWIEQHPAHHRHWHDSIPGGLRLPTLALHQPEWGSAGPLSPGTAAVYSLLLVVDSFCTHALIPDLQAMGRIKTIDQPWITWWANVSGLPLLTCCWRWRTESWCPRTWALSPSPKLSIQSPSL